LIKNYLHTRLRPWSFLALAALFALFDSQSGLGFVYLSNVFFLFASFLVFRLLDDAGSVYIDRAEHPERSYLYPEHYPHFLKLLLISLALYLLFIILSRARWDFIYLSAFLLSSGLAYFIFSRRAAVIALIPLLKYPVLLGCLLAWQDDSRHLLLALSTFFLMGAHELLEKDGTVQFIWGLGSLATAGILIFPIIENPLNGLYILGSIFLILVFRKSPYRPYIPLLYYPLSYFINSQFLV
jgi:hypothetical protein